jgi:hypothetical protein
MAHREAGFNFPIAIGHAPEYSVTAIPYAFLIDAEGVIAWRGNPGSLPDKVLRKALRGVREPTGEELRARVAKRVAHARDLVDDGLVYRARRSLEQLLEQAHDDYGMDGEPILTEAIELLGEVRSPENRAELDGQEALAKLLGFSERPREHLRSKKALALAKKVRKFAGTHAETAPRTALLAWDWVEILEQPWE